MVAVSVTHLFEPLTLRGTTFANRIWLTPMCQYSAADGVPGDWHLVHLGGFAAGGFGLVMSEATAVVPVGRITPQDTGLWNDIQAAGWRRITDAIHACGTLAGVQLAHAGRKASTFRPWSPVTGSISPDDGGWTTLAPSALAFPGYAVPVELTPTQIAQIPRDFAAAATRALAAGFDVVEIHAAHGYLLHQFLSPLSNLRTDSYGGALENRSRLLIEVVDAVRAVWPAERPLFVRVSATDWTDGGLTLEETVAVARKLSAHGVDLVDVSTAGNVPAQVPIGPGYQVPAARAVRAGAQVPVSAVGLITTAEQAEQILVDGAADAVLVGRVALREPRWPLRVAHELGVPVAEAGWQPQYLRGALH